MSVTVRLFASLREAFGSSTLTLDLPKGATAEEAWGRLLEICPSLVSKRASLQAAVNRRYAAFATPLADGDELAFIPPVSGG